MRNHFLWRWAKRLAALIAVLLLACCIYFWLLVGAVKPYAAAFEPQGADATPALQPKPDTHGRSGFRLLSDNNDALMSRIVLADQAQHSIDLQYYIFDADATGRLIAQHLLAAADRGVRVRVLVDDLDASNAFNLLSRLDAHPNIDVRLFNPFLTRDPSLLSKILQFMIEGRRLNRRMHNKSWIVDTRAAIIGGRNIGDAYFEDRGETHFSDLDVIAIGAIVPQIDDAFERYWDAKAAQPITRPGTQEESGELAQLRAELPRQSRPTRPSSFADALPDALPGGSATERPGQWCWGRAAVVADLPSKVNGGTGPPSAFVGPRLDAMIGAAQHEVVLISAYFVPGERDTKFFAGLARRGIDIKVLTNSLAATDEPLVQAGYVRYRRELLHGGVKIYELRPEVHDQPSAHGTSSGVSLHAKAVIVDHHLVFIGSMNLDLRSKLLNTEMGVIVDSATLGAAMDDWFQRASAPANAFHVLLDAHGDTVWRSVDAHGEAVVYTHEPDTSIWRRLRVELLRAVPIDRLL